REEARCLHCPPAHRTHGAAGGDCRSGGVPRLGDLYHRASPHHRWGLVHLTAKATPGPGPEGRCGSGTLGGRRRLRGSPRVVAARVEMEHDGLVGDSRLHLVLDLIAAEEYAAEVTRRATTLTAPHAPRDGAAQGSYGQPSRPLFRRRLFEPRRLRPNHDDVLPAL